MSKKTPLPPLPVLFLDIDGVLNTVEVQKAVWKGYGKTDPLEALMAEKVQLLNQLVGKVWFVASTRWVGRFTLTEIEGFLRHHGFTGSLDDITPRRMTSHKDAEIAWYLQDFPGVKGVVLDDEPIQPKRNCLMIRTNEKYGLTQAHIDQILVYLGGSET